MSDILTTPEIIEIWENSPTNFDLIRKAAEVGYQKGRIAQLREDNAELNAVLHVVDAQAQKVTIQ